MRSVRSHSRSFAARLLVAVYDALAALVCSLLLAGSFAQPAFAYVDPSVMTYTIQALAGVAVALSAVAGVAFRRTRRAIMKALNIDENANKDVDPSWTAIEADPSNLSLTADELSAAREEASDTASSGAASRKDARRNGDDLSWPKRFAMALVVSVFAVFTVEVVAPYEIVASSYGDLTFGVADIWWVMLLAASAIAVAIALVLSLLRNKFFTIGLVVCFAFGLCCYIQAFALNGGLPLADGRPVDWWGDHMTMMVVSALVWVVILVVPAVLCVKKHSASRIAACALSLALIVVQGVGVASLLASGADADSSPHGRSFTTEDGLFEVSDDNNVIVFVLDCYDTVRLQEAIEQDPAMLDEMGGFTWYQNHSGEMIPTAFAVPYLLTGQTPSEGQSVEDYLSERYTESSFLEDLRTTGWSIGVYTDTLGLSHLTKTQEQQEIFDNADNIHPISEFIVSPLDALKQLTKCALYRDMPWIAKQRFWFYTDEINTRVVSASKDAAPEETIYVLDDSSYYDRLRSDGLSISDDKDPGCFRFIHLLGAHVPFNYDENMNYVGEMGSTQVKQAIGSMSIVSTYLKQMKELGVYDDATIIITSDHGDWVGSMSAPNYATEPILLVKESGADSDLPVSVSDAPVSHIDFHASVLDAMGADYSSYGTRYKDIPEDMQRERTMYQITHENDNSHIRSLLLYYINGDVRDFANWTYSGKEWVTDYNNSIID